MLITEEWREKEQRNETWMIYMEIKRKESEVNKCKVTEYSDNLKNSISLRRKLDSKTETSKVCHQMAPWD